MTDFSDDEFEILDEAVTIDCEGITSIHEFWQRYIKEAKVDGADGFGRNLHALRDALWGGPGVPRYREIRFKNTQALSHLGNLLGDLQYVAALKEAHGFRLILE